MGASLAAAAIAGPESLVELRAAIHQHRAQSAPELPAHCQRHELARRDEHHHRDQSTRYRAIGGETDFAAILIMADSADNVLEVLIKLGVIGQNDLKAANDLMSEFKENSKLPPDLANTASFKGFEPLKKDLDETGSSAIDMRKKVLLARQALYNLVPTQMLGLTPLLFNPLTIGVGGLIAGVELFFNQIKKIDERYKNIVVSSQKVNDALHEMVMAGGTGEEQFVRITQTVAELHEETAGVGEKIRQSISDAELLANAMSDMLSATQQSGQEAFDVYKKLADLLKSTGVISPEQADLAQIDIQHAQNLQKFQDDRKKLAQEQANAQMQAEQYRETSFQFPGQTIEEKQKNAAQQKEDTQNRLAVIQAVIEKTKPLLLSLDQQIAAAKGQKDRPHFSAAALERDEQLYNSLVAQRGRMQADFDKAKSEFPAAVAAAAAAADAFNQLKEFPQKLLGFQQKVDETTAKLKAFDATIDQRIQNENRTTALAKTEVEIKGGATPNSIFKGGVDAVTTINQLVQSLGETVADITARGEAAEDKQTHLPEHPGEELTPTEKRDIDVYELLKREQEKVAALKQFSVALGENGDAVIAYINTATAGMHDAAQIMRAVQPQLDQVQKDFRDIKTQLGNHG
ncbi:MAG: hypothetical protein KGL39_13365 [Patescibacteria group bacterium]|nr:hypothetical protein [Patescibacteria group bacterium]